MYAGSQATTSKDYLLERFPDLPTVGVISGLHNVERNSGLVLVLFVTELIPAARLIFAELATADNVVGDNVVAGGDVHAETYLSVFAEWARILNMDVGATVFSTVTDLLVDLFLVLEV